MAISWRSAGCETFAPWEGGGGRKATTGVGDTDQRPPVLPLPNARATFARVTARACPCAPPRSHFDARASVASAALAKRCRGIACPANGPRLIESSPESAAGCPAAGRSPLKCGPRPSARQTAQNGMWTHLHNAPLERQWGTTRIRCGPVSGATAETPDPTLWRETPPNKTE